MDHLSHLEVAGRFPTLLDIVEAKIGHTTETVGWGPVIGADEIDRQSSTGGTPETVWWGPVIGADEPSVDDAN
jgi:hypothetical protein